MHGCLHSFSFGNGASFRCWFFFNYVFVRFYFSDDNLIVLCEFMGQFLKNFNFLLIISIKGIDDSINTILLNPLYFLNMWNILEDKILKSSDCLDKIFFHFRAHLSIGVQVILFQINFLFDVVLVKRPRKFQHPNKAVFVIALNLSLIK